MFRSIALGAAALISVSAYAQTAEPAARAMPANTLITVTPVKELTSKKMKLGDKVDFVTLGDVTEQGNLVIPRGSPVKGEVTFKTGKAIGGKSGKFEVSFKTVQVKGVEYALTGTHRQEGRGNTVGAVLGSIFISGRSAVMSPGMEARAFTAVAIPY